jgi:phosphopantothenoylcysteine decarboxylase/phosphopantothenate--cysteine ligase
MGFAMAQAAKEMGAEVTVIHGPVSIDPPKGTKTVQIESAEDLFKEVKAHSDYDVIIMAAAVSDFSPQQYEEQKIKKKKAENEIKLKKTPDSLAWLGEHRKNGQILIGFAMETQNLVDNAREKLEKKNIDWIVANSISNSESGFAVDTNQVELLAKNDRKSFEGTKKDVARNVLNYIFGN